MIVLLSVVVAALQLPNPAATRCQSDNPSSLPPAVGRDRLSADHVLFDAADTDSCGVGGPSDDRDSRDAAGMLAYHPEGLGLYRDPLEVLGPAFSAVAVLYLCEVNMLMQADTLAGLKFTFRGRKMCSEVCAQYQRKMIVDGPAEVLLLQAFCDYTGLGETLAESGLSTTCTCAYKVRCNRQTAVVMYTFEANGEGFVRVSYTEPNESQPIT